MTPKECFDLTANSAKHSKCIFEPLRQQGTNQYYYCRILIFRCSHILIESAQTNGCE